MFEIKEKNISKYFIYHAILLVIIASFGAEAILVYMQVQKSREESLRNYTSIITTKKKSLKTNIDRITNVFEKELATAEEEAHQNIRAIFRPFATLMLNQYATDKKNFQRALFDVSKEGGEYLFSAYDVKDKKFFCGKESNDMDMENFYANIERIVDHLNLSPEGDFLDGICKDSGKGAVVTYAQYFKEQNIVFFASIAKERVFERARRKLFSRIENINSPDGDYYFGSDFNGYSLLGPMNGKYVLDLQTGEGRYIVRELIALAKSGGGFIEYSLPKEVQKPDRERISYVKKLPGFDMYIGIGSSKKNLEEYLDQKEAFLKEELAANILKTTLFVIGFLLVSLSLTVLFIRKIESIIAEHKTKSQENHIKLQAALDSISSFIYYKDSDLKYIGGNKAFFDFAGRGQYDALGKFDYEIFPAYVDTFKSTDEYVLKYKTGIQFCIHMENEEDKQYFLHIKSPIMQENEVIGIIGIFTDITHIVEMEAEKRERGAMMAQQAKYAMMGEMIGMIAHQWKQPLSALNFLLLGLEDRLEGEISVSGEVGEILEKCNMQVAYMGETIDDFRSFFKPEKNRRLFASEAIAQETLKLVQTQLKILDIGVLIKNESSSETLVEGFPNELKQILLILVNNACDSLSKMGAETKREIEVRIHEDAQYHIIDVVDNGGGIKDENKTKIFESYFTTKAEKGTGIGLSLAKQIAQKSFGGDVVLMKSTIGAHFRVLLKKGKNG